MTNTIKVKPYNPVNELHSDDEIIDFLVDCYKEDSEGLTLARGMAFAMDSIGEPKTALLMITWECDLAERQPHKINALTSHVQLPLFELSQFQCYSS